MISTAFRTPTWESRRRLLEQKLSDLHKCTNLNHIKQIQSQILKSNLHQDPYIAPKLITAYSLSRQPNLSLNTFKIIQQPNTHLYNTLIRAYTQNSLHSHAFSTFLCMQRNNVHPDNFTYPFLLKACSGQFGLLHVQMIHTHVMKHSFCEDIFVPNALIDCYCKCGVLGVAIARKLFENLSERDVVSWNSMVSGLVKIGRLRDARKLFDEMPKRDVVSWNTILDGYVKAGDMNNAFVLFEKMNERNVVTWSTMVSGYSKVGDMGMARGLFDKMPVKNLVSWSIMVSGYAEKGFLKEALGLFEEMERSGLRPDNGTFVSVLSACAESGLLALGERIHVSVNRSKLRHSTQVCNALVDMYAKCGSLAKALGVFDCMVERDVVSWNSMIQGLATHGDGERALELFSRMIHEGFVPDGVTFIGVLCACTHVGLVDVGRGYFSSMKKDYGIVPQVEHYGCMIDLLGRGGHLVEAFELIKSMPMEPNAIIWGTLLGACRMHNNVELAEEAIDRLVKLNPPDANNYSVLSNIYANAGRWEDFAKVRLQMKGTSTQKLAGASSIEINDEVHEFTVADRLHPESSRIYNMINSLGHHLKKLVISQGHIVSF